MKMSQESFRKYFIAQAISLICLIASSSVAARSEMSPMLWKMAEDSVAAGKNVAVVVFLSDDSTSTKIQLIAETPHLSRDQRIKLTTSRLHERRLSSENSVATFLARHSSTPVRRLWVVPAFAATVPADAIDELSMLSGVRLIIPDVDLELVAPVSSSPAPALATSVANTITQINVPNLWRRGLTGKGRLVCSFDTGVQQSHPALASKWRGSHASLRSAWFSTVKPDTLPYDKAGHGTHTMGIMVGSIDADSFGVAPGAEWITAGVIDQGKSLNLTIGDILLAFQWALDPDGNPNTTDDVPDVILNSWGIPKGIFPACDATFNTAIENVEAAGIVTIFAAGNEGPTPMSLRQPADNATSPINTFSVGAVDSSLVVATFSSRGPSLCDTSKMKPEIVAPGVSIRSSTKGSAYLYMSGTSMAAPFIAGTVALLRQYNPNATVAQIKHALLSSTRDIGPTGEDNASGHGFVDASRALDFMPLPSNMIFSLAHKNISGAGIALPGEVTRLSLTLVNSTGQVGQVTGTLTSLVSGVATVQNSQTFFSFGIGGTTAVASPELSLTFGSSVPHGTSAPFRLYISLSNGVVIDSVDFTIVCGLAPIGSFASHTTSDLTVGVSDFGQYGLAAGSIYNLGGAGFHYRGGANLLYEAGIVLGRNALQVSSAIRDSAGQLRGSDFVPTSGLNSVTGTVDAQRLRARFVDARSAIPIPITVSQETIAQNSVAATDVVLFRYYLMNNSPDKLTGLRFGFLSDFDLGNTDSVGYEASLNLVWQSGLAGPFVGIVGLNNITSFKSLANTGGKTGWNRTQLFDLISRSGIDVSSSAIVGDQMVMVSTPSFDLYSGDSTEVAFAMVAADNLADLFSRAAEAQNMYLTPTGVDDPQNTLPEKFVLDQNYPNPFNPSTTISFSLAEPSRVKLSIYNVLGQEVQTILDVHMNAGNHSVEWDGRDGRGNEAASGVYLYRLTTSSESQTKKMVLVR